jgi:quercetin 2,3-dioxygenase
MIHIRRGNERGHTQLDWLDSRHTFSFDQYYDPNFSGFRHLRVINEDIVAPGKGFGTHPHRDMEILTYIIDGALEHRDSMGNGSVIRPGDVQRMSAGTGVTHSEFNPSKTDPVHLLQIWILPEKRGLKPSYEQHTFSAKELGDGLRLLASLKPSNGAVTIHQDVALYGARLAPGAKTTYTLDKDRYAWLQVARGKIRLNGQELQAGDGAAIEDEDRLDIVAEAPSEILLFDLV